VRSPPYPEVRQVRFRVQQPVPVERLVSSTAHVTVSDPLRKHQQLPQYDDMARIAQCHCGDLRLVCDGEPRKISMCHCLDCQRRSGSAFSVAVFYSRAAVRSDGKDPERFQRASTSGYPVSFFFCPRCGSNVWWEPERMPGLVGVALGAFADPDFPAPVQSVWTKEMHRWVTLPEEVVRFDVAPPPRPPQ
jgi:hypothetical protein